LPAVRQASKHAVGTHPIKVNIVLALLHLITRNNRMKAHEIKEVLRGLMYARLTRKSEFSVDYGVRQVFSGA
jgi:hypothetical protein